MTESRLEYGDIELPPQHEPSRRSLYRRTSFWVVLLACALVVFGVSRDDVRQRLVLAGEWAGNRVKGLAKDSPDARLKEYTELLTYEVKPVDLRLTALDSGTLESASSINVLSAVEGEATIISVIPEGTPVAAGDVVVELESSGLRTRLTEQRITVERAADAHSQARQASTAAESQAKSDIARAELVLELARLDLKNYVEGEYPVLLRGLRSETALASEERERALVQLRFSEDLARDGLINSGELDADRFKVTQVEYKLENAREKERLLEEYTFPRVKRELESKIEEAERALERTRIQTQAAVEQATTSLRTQEATLALERSRLERLQEQIDKCAMRAPQDGVVVYPIPPDSDDIDKFIRQGNRIHERQHVFSIPDTDELQVSMAIHEAIVNQVRPGMPARIWVDVYPDLELRGEVLRVSPLPQPEDWRRTTVKFYETKVGLSTQTAGLRPGMSAKVEILLDDLGIVLAAPVQAVVQRGRSGVCYVLGSKPELRHLMLGKANSQYIAVLDGLNPGERVVLSPDVLGIPADVFGEEAEVDWAPVDFDALPSVEVVSGVPQSQETEYEGELTGSTTAVGKAELKVKDKGSERSYQFEIKVFDGPPGESWDVTVDGTTVGSVNLGTGTCEVEWKTKLGNFPENFPLEAGEGSVVTLGPDLQGVLSLVQP